MAPMSRVAAEAMIDCGVAAETGGGILCLLPAFLRLAYVSSLDSAATCVCTVRRCARLGPARVEIVFDTNSVTIM
jgi:hypothetical protein